jgi:hypothetical protein
MFFDVKARRSVGPLDKTQRLWLQFRMSLGRLPVTPDVELRLSHSSTEPSAPVNAGSLLACHIVYRLLITDMRLKIKSSIFWDITPCSLLEVIRRFGGTYRLCLQCRRISQARNQRENRWQAELCLLFGPDDGGDMLLRDGDKVQPDYTASRPRRGYCCIKILVGFEVSTAVVMKSIIFWDMTPCSPFSCNRRFGGTFRLHLQGLRADWFLLKYFSDSEDGGDMFLRNVGCNSTDYMASYPRRWYSSKCLFTYLPARRTLSSFARVVPVLLC